MKVITNNVPRDVIYGSELPQAERKEFDYHDWDKIDNGEESAEFFRYKGSLYDLGTFIRTSDESGPMAKWDGHNADSFYTATLVRYVENGERVIAGTYIA